MSNALGRQIHQCFYRYNVSDQTSTILLNHYWNSIFSRGIYWTVNLTLNEQNHFPHWTSIYGNFEACFLSTHMKRKQTELQLSGKCHRTNFFFMSLLFTCISHKNLLKKQFLCWFRLIWKDSPSRLNSFHYTPGFDWASSAQG